MFLALRVVASLGVVLGTIWYAYKRISRNGTAAKKLNPINVISRQGISGKAAVVLVEAEGQRFLLGVTEQSVNILHTTAVAPAVAVTPADLFASLLADASSEEPQFRAAATSSAQPAPANAHSPIAGSILSPDTWKRAYTALRQGPAR